MAFKKFELTNSGINLLAQVQANQGSLNFTKIKIGSGTYTGDVKLLTDVITEFHNFPVTSTQVQADKSVKIQAPFDNSTFTQAYLWREIGIFAKLGDAGTEVLYSYSSDDTPDTIPNYDGGNNKYRRTLDIRNYISDVANVTLTITNVTDKYDFNTHTEMKTASYLTDGDRINLWGKTSQNDGIVEKRVVKTISGKDGVLLDNGLYANLLEFDFREEINLNAGGQKGNYDNMQDVSLVVDSVYIDSNTGIKYKCQTATPALPSPNPDFVTDITNKNLQKQIENLSYEEFGDTRNGYRKWNDGRLEVWGFLVVADGQRIDYYSGAVFIGVIPYPLCSTNGSEAMYVSVSSADATGFTIYKNSTTATNTLFYKVDGYWK